MSEMSGTPDNAVDAASAANPGTKQDGSEQKWQEALKWKEKAEAYNRLEAEKNSVEQRLAEMERVAYSGAAKAATDPTADLMRQLQEYAQFDPASKAALLAMQESAKARAEQWLLGELMSVPDSKRFKVAGLVRASNYQLTVAEALDVVTDPEAIEYQNKYAELQAENERLKSRGPVSNGASPSAAYPVPGSGNNAETMPWSEMQRTLQMGGAAAKDIRQKWDSGEIRPDYGR